MFDPFRTQSLTDSLLNLITDLVADRPCFLPSPFPLAHIPERGVLSCESKLAFYEEEGPTETIKDSARFLSYPLVSPLRLKRPWSCKPETLIGASQGFQVVLERSTAGRPRIPENIANHRAPQMHKNPTWDKRVWPRAVGEAGIYVSPRTVAPIGLRTGATRPSEDLFAELEEVSPQYAHPSSPAISCRGNRSVPNSLCVLLMEVGTRRICIANATAHQRRWTLQQLREAIPSDLPTVS